MRSTADRRGRYDRKRTVGERAGEQRRVLLEAALGALDEIGGASLTVEDVLRRAHVGRNTFYAHFDGTADLMGGVREHALDVLFERLDGYVAPSRTPLERIRATAAGWLLAVEGEAGLARAALSHVVGVEPAQLGTRAVDGLVMRLDRLVSDARRDGMLSSPVSAAMLHALAGAYVGVAFTVLDTRWPPSRTDAEKALVALTLRAMR
jgi:AcrR family transcriptional regulator